MKVYLAAVHGFKGSSFDVLLEHKPRFILESFYYMTDDVLRYSKTKFCESFLLDSGAFTFMNSKKEKRNIDFYKFVSDYADFISQHDIKLFLELDIDSIVGYEEVKKLRQILEKKTEKKCIPVWHRSRGLGEYINLTKEYDYIAIGGIAMKVIKKSEYAIFAELLKIARNNNCKVHGLGLTGMTELKKYPFHSVDSTSWKMSYAFGNVCHFNGTEVKTYSKKTRVRQDCTQLLRVHNFKEWIKFSNYMDEGD